MASQDPTDRILLNMVDPMTVIRNATRTAQERLADGGSTAEIQKDLTYIRAAAAQLNRLLGEARAIKR